MLGDLVPGARVLDLFAGSGALGLECLSRGAASALFVDQDRGACEVMKKNLAKTRLEGASIRQGDVFKVVAQLAASDAYTFDLVFADPPYAHHPGDKDLIASLMAVEALPHLLPAGGHLLLESLATPKPPVFDAAVWELLTDRSYGSTRIVLLRKR
jgi:16S rRNA (guanine966-N2)-methyltransferase